MLYGLTDTKLKKIVERCVTTTAQKLLAVGCNYLRDRREVAEETVYIDDELY